MLINIFLNHKSSGSTSSYKKSKIPKKFHGLSYYCFFLSYYCFIFLSYQKFSILLPNAIPITMNNIKTISFFKCFWDEFDVDDILLAIEALYLCKSYSYDFKLENF